jgi:nicotinamide-nucleotide amidase
MNAEIITIGDELLIGQVIDTNSAYMAKELNKIGVGVQQITSISDARENILAALREAAQRVKLILITGGLGPTKDDITKTTLAEYTNDRLIMHEPTLQHIESMMTARNIAMNRLNVKQAEVPEHATVIPNSCGTAPGIWFEKNGVTYISMPGVPFEMKVMMQHEILPRLQQRTTNIILHRSLLVSGISESALALMIEQWENNLPAHIKLAYLPSGGMIRLRLSTSGADRESISRQVEAAIAELQPILGKNLLSTTDELPEELAGRLLTEKGKTVATAESCTGGNIAHALTSIAGSSNYFKGSVVAYADEIKINILHVHPSDIEQHGAVSREVVEQMARNVRELMKTDYGIATSGVAGPGGGTPEKPVGTVWVALADKSQVSPYLFHYNDVRENNIQRTTTAALNLLIKKISRDF